jgi:hypothetical protein
VRVDVGDPIARRIELRAPQILRPVDHLSMQVGQVHQIEVHQPEVTDAGGGEV